MKKFKNVALILCSISSAFLLASCSNNTANHFETKTKVSDEQTSNIEKRPGIQGYEVVHVQSKKIKELLIPSIIIKSIEYDKHSHRFTVHIQDPDGKRKWNYQFEDKH